MQKPALYLTSNSFGGDLALAVAAQPPTSALALANIAEASMLRPIWSCIGMARLLDQEYLFWDNQEFMRQIGVED